VRKKEEKILWKPLTTLKQTYKTKRSTRSEDDGSERPASLGRIVIYSEVKAYNIDYISNFALKLKKFRYFKQNYVHRDSLY